MYLLTGISLALFLFSLSFYHYVKAELLFSLSITFGVCFYHFAMRLLVGGVINGLFHNRMNYRRAWFRPRRFEKRLYTLLQIRRWKGRLPTYSPETFSTALHSWEEIAMATCQAEVVHEVIALFSFLPLLLIIPFGTPIVFVVTSVLSALFDLAFVILQRYHRPMLIRLLNRQEKRRNA